MHMCDEISQVLHWFQSFQQEFELASFRREKELKVGGGSLSRPNG
jgi:hypothetical protein